MKFPILGQDVDIERCWQTTGVWGSRTCTELESHNHCKNCPVYLDVGQQILNRARPHTPSSTLSGTTAQSAACQVHTTPYLLLPILEEILAVPLGTVRYVVPQEKRHSIPHRRRGSLLGITHIHGQIMPVLSLHHLLLGTTEAQEVSTSIKTRYVVMHVQGKDVAFPISGEITTAGLPEPLTRTTASQSRFVSSTVQHDGRLIGVIDMDRLHRAIVSEIFDEGVSQ